VAPDLVIYGLKGSPFVRKVQVALAEKGVDFEFENASPFAPKDWFLEISPARRIPVLRDRSVGEEGVTGTLPDSSAILAYIERKHPEPALFPKNDFDYGRALWIEEFCDTVLATPVGMGLFRPMVMVKLMGKEPNVDVARKTLEKDLPPVFDYLDAQAKGREFLLGDRFGIADISVATHFVNFEFAGARIDSSRWPHLAAYLERMLARPSFAACVEEERQALPQSDIEL